MLDRQILKANGTPMYFLIFATDNDAGEKIMDWVFDRVRIRVNEELGQTTLFDMESGPREREARRKLDRAPGPRATGHSSCVRPSRIRPPAFDVRPPHCLKKNATPSACATVAQLDHPLLATHPDDAEDRSRRRR